MILEKNFKETDTEIVGQVDDRIEMGVDVENIGHLMMILSSNLYQNSIGSIIREYTSNAIDANVEAGVEEPVIVGLKKTKMGNWEFTVQDFGTGLDDKDFRSIISKYGKSTKRDKVDQLGFYGLGTKSAFSYTDSFYFVCRKNGKERKYLLYKSETGFTIDLLFEEDTVETNGVMVVVPVKEGDYDTFRKEIRNQLAYFDNVFFDVELRSNNIYSYSHNYDPTPDLNKEFSIYRETDFQYSTFHKSNEMHLTLGRVTYPIDWKQLNIPAINVPVALRFDLSSGIFPIPNRENIIWNQATKDAVMAKIKLVAKWFIDKYNENVVKSDTLVEAWDYLNTYEHHVKIVDKLILINALETYGPAIKDVEIKGMKYIKPGFFKQHQIDLVSGLRIVAEVSSGVLKTKVRYQYFRNPDKAANAILDDTVKITGYFRDFLKTKGFKLYYKPALDPNPRNKAFYDNFLRLSSVDSSLHKEYIKEYEFFRTQFIKDAFTDLTALHTSQEFEDYKKNNKKKVTTTYVSKKIHKTSEDVTIAYEYKVSGRDVYAFGKKALKLDELYKNKFMTILVGPDETIDIYQYAKLFNLQKTKFAKVGVKDLKKILDLKLHNFMKFNDLDKLKAFSRIATAIRARKAMDKWDSLTNGKTEIVKKHLIKQKALYDELSKYQQANFDYNATSLSGEFMTVAETKNLWDPTMIDKVKEMENSTQEYDFITYIRVPGYNEKDWDYANVINSLLLMKKMKFDKYPEFQLVNKT